MCSSIGFSLNFKPRFLTPYRSFNKLMQQKDEEERHEIEVKLEEIRQNHYAKIVVKRWKKLVKKNRKKKKGKKDQQKKKRK